MKNSSSIAAGLLIGAALILPATSAMARVNVDVNVGVPGVYVESRPVYVQPRPVYVEPGPIYVQPRSYYYDRPGYGYGHRHHDRDHDGIPNRYDRDRDGDGVPNRWDRRPDNPRRY